MNRKKFVSALLISIALSLSFTSCSNSNAEDKIAEYSRAVESDKRSESAWSRFAEAYYESGDLDSAIETLENALDYIDSAEIVERIKVLKEEKIKSMTATEKSVTNLTESESEAEAEPIEEEHGAVYLDRDYYLCWEQIPDAEYYTMYCHDKNDDDGGFERSYERGGYESGKETRYAGNIVGSYSDFTVDIYAYFADKPERLIGTWEYTPKPLFKEEGSFKVDDTQQLMIDGQTNAEWISLNPYVTEVNGNGKVTFLREGSSTICCRYEGVLYYFYVDTFTEEQRAEIYSSIANLDFGSYQMATLLLSYGYDSEIMIQLGSPDEYTTYNGDTFDVYHYFNTYSVSDSPEQYIYTSGSSFGNFVINDCGTLFGANSPYEYGEYVDTTGEFSIECEIEHLYAGEYFAYFSPSDAWLPCNWNYEVQVHLNLSEESERELGQYIGAVGDKARFKITGDNYSYTYINTPNDYYDDLNAHNADLVKFEYLGECEPSIVGDYAVFYTDNGELKWEEYPNADSYRIIVKDNGQIHGEFIYETGFDHLKTFMNSEGLPNGTYPIEIYACLNNDYILFGTIDYTHEADDSYIKSRVSGTWTLTFVNGQTLENFYQSNKAMAEAQGLSAEELEEIIHVYAYDDFIEVSNYIGESTYPIEMIENGFYITTTSQTLYYDEDTNRLTTNVCGVKLEYERY